MLGSGLSFLGSARVRPGSAQDDKGQARVNAMLHSENIVKYEVFARVKLGSGSGQVRVKKK